MAEKLAELRSPFVETSANQHSDHHSGADAAGWDCRITDDADEAIGN
jgi:hypothetical protein